MMHGRTYFFCALLILSTGFVSPAQEKGGNSDLNFSVFAAPSKILNALDIYENLLETSGYVGYGAQMGFQKRSDSADWFEKTFNYPEFGFGLWYQPLSSSLQFKNASRLGSMLNIYGYGNWNLLRNGRRFSFGPAVKLGVSIAGSKYSPLTNPSNLYIGTNLEYFAAVGFEGALKLSDHFAITIAAMGVHHSNGKQGIPNYGLNEVSISAGAKYYVKSSPVKAASVNPPVKPKINGHLTISPYLATGFHSCERIWDATGRQGYPPLYQRIMTGADFAYRYHPLFGSGVGFDMVYTPNIEDLKACDRMLHPEKYRVTSYCPVYFGVSLFQQFFYKRFEIHVKFGYYLFKQLGIIEDWGKNYQKIGFRYLFRNNIFLGFDMLTVRFDSSDCLEFSVGYSIPLKR